MLLLKNKTATDLCNTFNQNKCNKNLQPIHEYIKL